MNGWRLNAKNSGLPNFLKAQKMIPRAQTSRKGIMARPIEATPVLRGQDAAAFIRAAQNPRPYTPRKFDTAKMSKNIKRILKEIAEKQ
jgi:hypothetical protein